MGTRAILALLLVLTAVAVFTKLRVPEAEVKPDKSLRAATPTPQVTIPTPKPNQSAQEILKSLEPPPIIDEKRAPDWVLSHTMWRREELLRWRGRNEWLYRYNRSRVMPRRETGEALRDCTASVAFRDLEANSRAYMTEAVGNWYRFGLLVDAKPGIFDFDTEKTNFYVRIATTEYYPEEWQKTTTRELAAKLGIPASQIELTVPPKEPEEGDDWVEGTTLNRIPKNKGATFQTTDK